MVVAVILPVIRSSIVLDDAAGSCKAKHSVAEERRRGDEFTVEE